MSFSGEEGSVLSKVVFFFFLDVVVLSPPPKGSLLDVDDIAKASSRNFLFRSIDRYYGEYYWNTRGGALECLPIGRKNYYY